MTAIFGWIAIGLIVALVGKLVMPGRDPGGLVVAALLGIAGAMLAGFAGQAAGLYAPGGSAGLVAAVAGAVVLLLLYRSVMRARS